jgi:hypothetical protein
MGERSRWRGVGVEWLKEWLKEWRGCGVLAWVGRSG